MEHWHPNPDFFFQVGAGPVLDVGPYYVTDLIHLIWARCACHGFHRQCPQVTGS